jgi:hypothetical protein
MPTAEQIMQLLEQQRYQKMREDLLKRNLAYANPNWKQELTQLPPDKEKAFAGWLKANKVPFNPQDKFPDYDMRGYYQSLMQGQAQNPEINAVDSQLHYPDTFKTPYHQSFSRESKWATENAPSWQGNKLVSPKGEVVFDEEAAQKQK